MQKMKKSNKKARSQRAIDMENERLAIEEEERKAKEQKERRMSGMVNTMISGYGLAAGILSILFDWMFIIALIGIGLSVTGIIRNKEHKESKDFKLAAAGLAVSIISIIYRLIFVFK